MGTDATGGDPAAASDQPAPGAAIPPRVGLPTVLKEWGRIGCIGVGGPPAHIALLRKLCVQDRHWLDAREFEDAVAACNLLPGPASTQLAIFCAWPNSPARSNLRTSGSACSAFGSIS